MDLNFESFKNVISYTSDRIYCAGECGGKFNEAIDNIAMKFKDHMSKNKTYNPLQDLDDEGNNPLHLVAKNGICGFFSVFRDHESFNKLKNMPNNRNETPLDLVKLRPYDSMTLFNQPYEFIVMWVTNPYYSKSFPELEKLMVESGCTSNFSFIEMLISYANKIIEQCTCDQSVKKEAAKTIELRKFINICMPCVSKNVMFNICFEDEDEELQKEINRKKKKREPYVTYLREMIHELEKLPSHEINSFDDLPIFDKPVYQMNG